MLVTLSDLTTYMDINLSPRQQDAAEMVLQGLQSEMETFLGRPVEVTEFIEETHVLDANHVNVPMGSYFYNQGLGLGDSNPTGIITYAAPPNTVYVRNTPVASVSKVEIDGPTMVNKILGEAQKRIATITAATVSSGTATYTAANHGFTIGQSVTIREILPSTLNISAKIITSVALNTFSVANSGATGTYVSGGEATANGSDYTIRRYGIDVYTGYANDILKITYRGGLDGQNIKMFRLMLLRAATREMQNMHDDVVGVKDLNSRNVAVMETGFLETELMQLKKYSRRRIG
jgi:uncharacterized protein (DUF2164 family)